MREKNSNLFLGGGYKPLNRNWKKGFFLRISKLLGNKETHILPYEAHFFVEMIVITSKQIHIQLQRLVIKMERALIR